MSIRLATGVLAAAASALLALAAPASLGSGPPRYVSIGDSLAAGSQPDARGVDGPSGEGYADVLGRRLKRAYPGLRTHRLSCGGADTRTLLAGGAGCQQRGEPGQLVQAERFLAGHPETVLVTVNIGDNDVERCIHVNPPAVDVACLHRGEATIRRNLPVIARRLKAAAGPRTAIVGVLDYNQFLALWLDGGEGRAVARRSVRIIGSLNARMARIYRAAGVTVADAGVRFRTSDLTTRRARPGFGRVPLAVDRICRWTWACSDPPIGHDDHARATGYHEIAQAVLDALARGTG
ncbi:MAG: SGNH/GDSL hydrolase family protein [Solirubrobacteraceae bacterium]